MDIPREAPRRSRRGVLLAFAGVTTLVLIGVGVGRLRAAAPSVESSGVWMDTVRRGPMVREVLGHGILVPEEVRWITAKSSARVERVLVKAGARVQADSPLLELSNSDLELQALEAERQLAQAEAELANLRATLRAQTLAQKSAIATLGSDLSDARRRARADEELSKKGFLAALDLEQTRDRAVEMNGRLAFEKKRLGELSRGVQAQLTAHLAQIERLRSIAEFRKREVQALKQTAGVEGVVQELSLQPGQTVAAGAVLAKVVQPDRLKAEIRVPETQAKDVQIGQKTAIDTHNALIPGRVARIDPAAQSGSVLIDVTLEGRLPLGTRPDLNVEGTIEIERMPSVLFVGRPAGGQPGAPVGLFRLDKKGGAVRTNVQLGRASVKSVEIVAGLAEGDQVILSDMSRWSQAERIRLQ
jgi:HlyD family secretion protein